MREGQITYRLIGQHCAQSSETGLYLIQPRCETTLLSELQVLSLTGPFTPWAQRKGKPPGSLAHDQLCVLEQCLWIRRAKWMEKGWVEASGTAAKMPPVVQVGVTEAFSCLGSLISPCSIRKREAGNICISNRRQFDTGD